MVSQIRDRERHANGVQIPKVWASGYCYHGHDITIERNVQMHDRTAQRGGFAMRCGECKRFTETSHVVNLPPKRCLVCQRTFRAQPSDGPARWAHRKYCSGPCARRANANRARHRMAAVDITLADIRPHDGWQQRARCNGVELTEFYGREGHNGAALHADAEDVTDTWCRTCPVRRECLLDALARDERWGIWGGLTPLQRDEYARIWKALRAPVEEAA